MKTSRVPGSQAHVPELRTRQVLTKGVPGANSVLSGTVTSATQRAPRVQPAAVVGSGGGDSVGGAAVGAGAAVSGVGDGAAGGGVAVTTTVATGPQASAASNRTTAGPIRMNRRFFSVISLLSDNSGMNGSGLEDSARVCLNFADLIVLVGQLRAVVLQSCAWRPLYF